MVGKLVSSAAYATVYLFTAELFPTVVRSTTMGTSAFFAGVGGMLAPYIVVLVSIPIYRYLADLIEHTFSREKALYLACNDQRAFFTSDVYKNYNLWSCQKRL